MRKRSTANNPEPKEKKPAMTTKAKKSKVYLASTGEEIDTSKKGWAEKIVKRDEQDVLDAFSQMTGMEKTTAKYEFLNKLYTRHYDELSKQEQRTIAKIKKVSDIKECIVLDTWSDDHVVCCGMKINGVQIGFWWSGVITSKKDILEEIRRAKLIVQS